MKQIELQRVCFSPKGTFGVFIDSNTCLPIAFSLEKPWLDNKREISCIPCGTYVCKMKEDGKKILVGNVPGRDGIQIEVFNYEEQSKGCIAAGMELLRKDGVVVGVARSQEAFNLLLDSVGKTEFSLMVN